MVYLNDVQVQVGYKKVNNKIIPVDWNLIKFNNLVDLLGGNPFSSKDLVDEGIPWLKISNVGIGKINWKNIDYLPKEYIKKFCKYILVSEDLVIALTRPVLNHKLKIAKLTSYDVPSLLNQRVAKIDVKKDVSKNYIYYYISTPRFVYDIEALIAGSDPPNIGFNDFKSLGIAIPKFSEQENIANILIKADSLINNLQSLIEKKKEYKKGLMQQVLTVKKRFPGFTDEFKVVKLSEILFEHKLKSTGTEDVYSVSVHKGVINQIEHLGRIFAAKDTSNYKRACYGDIIYTKSPTGNFPFGIVKQSHIKNDVILSPLYCVYKPSNYYIGYILHCFFNYKINMNNYLHPLVERGAKNTMNISASRFLEGKLLLPTSLKEQKLIADTLSKCDEEIELLEKELEQYKLVKKSLMQKLLTGQVRTV